MFNYCNSLEQVKFISTILGLYKLQKQPPEVSLKKGAINKFGKFTGKHLCRSLFNKVAGLFKKETPTQVFSS